MAKDQSIPAVVLKAAGSPDFYERHPHCILLSGGSERQRIVSARFLAKALECTAEKKPCNRCDACRKIENGVHPDIFVLEPPPKSKNVRMEDIRAMKEFCLRLPNEGRNRICLIPDGAKIREDGQNAILKIIEEPPSHVCILIGVAVRSSLLPTVLSRSFDLHIDDSVISSVSGRTEKKISQIVVGIVQAMVQREEYALVTAMAPLEKDRESVKLTAERLCLLCRNAFSQELFQSAEEDENRSAALLRKEFSVEDLLSVIQAAELTADEANKNANGNLLLSLFALRLYQIVKKEGAI